MIIDRLTKLRKLFIKYSIDSYLVNTSDEYLSEYIADYAKRLEYLTGFTGSNGILLVTKIKAYFFTDSRYLEQSNYQLDKDIVEIKDIKIFSEFLLKNEAQLSKIGYDPKLFSHKFILSFNQIDLYPIEDNLVDVIWLEKEKKQTTVIYVYPDLLAGKNYQDKLKDCRNFMKQNGGDALIVSKADSICWLLNLRANDVKYTPILLGLVIITNKNTYLFTDLSRVTQEVILSRKDIFFYEESEITNIISELDNEVVLVDYSNANNWLVNLIKNTKNINDPTLLARACKNIEEINFIKEAHIYDAIALIEFLADIENIDLGNYTEFDLAEKLQKIRQRQLNYVSDSFATICGFKENGAIIHYQPTKKNSVKIVGLGMLLIDSGGQYIGGTTDVTRTIFVGGNPSLEEKKYYTLVLKGHIALANIKFPQGTTGANLDILARQYLWQYGLDYKHSTGHGVGAFLSVHEGPQAINQVNNIPLQIGMVISNEPGYYKIGSFGIRIEGMMYVNKADYADFLRFTQLTLVPFDKKLLDLTMLNQEELTYISNYYKDIRDRVGDKLSDNARRWFENQCLI